MLLGTGTPLTRGRGSYDLILILPGTSTSKEAEMAAVEAELAAEHANKEVEAELDAVAAVYYDDIDEAPVFADCGRCSFCVRIRSRACCEFE